MTIAFEPLNESHFSLLFKWVETPHVKRWWDSDVNWTMELIRKKSESYVNGFKVLHLKDGQTITKPIRALIIKHDETPVGYIQYYNKHDFPSHHGYDSIELPESCAGIDMYIGEPEYLGRGIASMALNQLIKQEIFPKYRYAFVDPELNNEGAIKAYGRAGFKPIRSFSKEGVLWMLRSSDVSESQSTDIILCQLSSIEPLFHHPDKFGRNEKDIENQMCDEFWEVGASGNIYTKEDVIRGLVERYSNPDYEDIWEASDFEVREITPGNYLLTYSLIQDKIRYTRRVTIWRRVEDIWKVLYHQGTVVAKFEI